MVPRNAKPSARAPKTLPAARPNTLRLNSRELGALLDTYDAANPGKGKANRDFVRWPFRRDSVRVLIQNPGSAETCVTMACRNISRGGVSLLHSCYLHPGTRCTVGLPHPDRGEVPISGWIARCNHRSGVIHELGIAFAEPVDVRQIVRPDFFADCFSLERVDPDKLCGNLLCVDDSEMDLRIVKHFLRGTQLTVTTAGSIAQTAPLIGPEFDLVIADFCLPDGSGSDLVTSLRQRGSAAPVIVVTSDTSAVTREQLAAVQADAFLAKPITQQLLLRAIAEFLLVRGSVSGHRSTLPADDAAAPLVDGFVASARQYAKRLDEIIRKGDAAQARSLCLQIAGTAPTVGFSPLGELAAAAAQSLSGSMSTAESLKPLRALIAACERARQAA